MEDGKGIDGLTLLLLTLTKKKAKRKEGGREGWEEGEVVVGEEEKERNSKGGEMAQYLSSTEIKSTRIAHRTICIV